MGETSDLILSVAVKDKKLLLLGEDRSVFFLFAETDEFRSTVRADRTNFVVFGSQKVPAIAVNMKDGGCIMVITLAPALVSFV